MRILKSGYRFMSSMKFGLILLAVIGLMSAIGSGISPDYFYQTVIFQVLLVLLLLNMAACSFNQLSKLVGSRSQLLKNKSRSLRQAGMLALHAGVVLILIGGAVYAFQGQNEQIRIEQGQAVDIAQVIPNAEPFSIKLEDFAIEFNDDGSPAQYCSSVSLLEEGDVKEQHRISVNNPLEYGGIKAYQSGFGYLVKLQEETSSGGQEQITLGESEHQEIKGTDKALRIYKYIPDYDPQYGMNSKSLRPDNPRIIYSIYQQGSLLSVGAASFGEKVEIDPGVTLTFGGVKPFTVLTVKRDPGLSLALAGGLMLMLGTCLTLFAKPKIQEDVQ